jgi:ABC-type multidrug transport system fused ATPase/permease subunit
MYKCKLIMRRRLSTIEHADVIYAVEGGKVVEAGTHDELLGLKRLFHHLHQLQFQEEGAEESITTTNWR